MPKPSGKPSRKLLLLVSVILFFVLIFAGYHSLRGNAGVLFSDFLHPYLAAERIAVDAVADQSLLLLNRHELAARLTELDRDNRLLAIRAAENRALREENRTLRQALSLPAPAGWKYRTALIVRRDPLLWNERFTLNLGSGDGVVSGAAVLGFSSDGTPCLVGVIDRVGNRSSEVETIFSPGLRLSTDFPTTGGNGILNTGDRHPASGKLPVGTLPANLRFTPGEPVETTGFERGIPRGIRIGELETVEEVNAAFSSALYLSGTIRPAANPGNLHFLVVALRNDEPKEESRRP